ncbi:MAG: nitrate ABC transporter substrate-binding protein [Pseudonocardiaceae bacterium]|nr:nitrate ABC transporter substrate-binding protein [Pseudonocardiaceae bacterium]
MAFALAGCGGSGQGGAAAGPQTIRVGVIPIVDVAPVYLGMQRGFFEESGLNLELSSGQGGAAIIPGVVGGSLDIGFGNNTSLVLAASKGLPLQVIASGVYSTGERGEDYVELLVGDDSPIRSAADLAGKTVAVNTLQNLGDTSVRDSVRDAGGDPEAVRFVEMPFPNMNAALAGGEVDAIWQVEPFLALAKAQGHRVIASPLVDTKPDLMVSTFFTTEQYAGQNADVVNRFKSAIDRSLTYAQQHPDEVRRIIPSYLDVPPEVAAEMVLPTWDPRIDRETFDVLVDLGTRDGLLEEKPRLDELLG